LKTYEKIILAVILIVGLSLIGIGTQDGAVTSVMVGSLLTLLGIGIYVYRKL